MVGNTAFGVTVTPRRRRYHAAIASRSAWLPAVAGYARASVAAASASRTTAGVGSTGEPIERFRAPFGCSAARAA